MKPIITKHTRQVGTGKIKGRAYDHYDIEDIRPVAQLPKIGSVIAFGSAAVAGALELVVLPSFLIAVFCVVSLLSFLRLCANGLMEDLNRKQYVNELKDISRKEAPIRKRNPNTHNKYCKSDPVVEVNVKVKFRE
jgi:hypothetical protein